MSDSPDSQSLDIEATLLDLWRDDDRAVSALAGASYGQVIGQYRIRALLGSGSFGLVYLADDIATEKPVALKVPRIEVLLNQEMRKRFCVEADIIGRLRHDNIVEILRSDVDEESTMPFIACSWCTGPDLGEYLSRNRPSWQESVRLMIKVCEAIHFAHQQGVTHRDIKPANIILHGEVKDSDADSHSEVDSNSDAEKGLDCFEPKVTDFGLARLADPIAADTRTGVILGTPAYMAPEQIMAGLGNDQKHATHEESTASDVYSLGAVLFEMLNGAPPSISKSWLDLVRMERSSLFAVSLDWKAEAPRSLKKVVETSLRNHSAGRYQSAQLMADDLRRVLDGEKTVGRSVSIVQRFAHWFQLRDWMKVAGYFAIASQTIFAAWMILADLVKIPFGLLTSQQYLELLPMLAMLAVTGSLTVIVAGILSVRRKAFAPWVGAAFVAYNLYLPLSALIGDPRVFSEIYAENDPYLSFLVHFIIVLIFSSQLVLFILAIVHQLVTKRKAKKGD